MMVKLRLELTLRMYANLEATDAQVAVDTLERDLEAFLSRKSPAWQFFVCPVKDMRLLNMDTMREIPVINREEFKPLMDTSKWQK